LRIKHRVAGVGLGLLLLAVPVLAHHGFETEYDAKKKVKLSGVVNKVSWTNPHMRVYIDVTDKDGTVTTWNMELTSPNSVQRQGWRKSDLVPGEKVTFEGYAGKIVESRGSLASITKVGQGTPLFVAGGPEAAKEGRPVEKVEAGELPCQGCAGPRGAVPAVPATK
jgi:hypothetical protein